VVTVSVRRDAGQLVTVDGQAVMVEVRVVRTVEVVSSGGEGSELEAEVPVD
jgi:hypothetical protein